MSDVTRLTLALDCSTPHLAVALVDDRGTTVAGSTRDVGRLHAALITTLLTELFARAGVPRTAVGDVRVGVGPGSYTGVRVAVAAAKGLGRAWDVPVLGVYSLLAQAGPDLAVGEHGVVVLDARRGNVYAQPCTRVAGGRGAATMVVSLGPPEKVALDSLTARFPGWRVMQAKAPDAAELAVTTDARGAEPLYL